MRGRRAGIRVGVGDRSKINNREGSIMSRISRRGLLKLSGTGAVAAGSGGLAGIFATGRAPAYAQGTTVHWL